MSRNIFCEKLKETTVGLTNPPFPGPLGEKIFNHVSEKAWKEWITHQTMLINEYRLSLIDPKSREFLHIEMEKYFFGEGSDQPTGFTPEK